MELESLDEAWVVRKDLPLQMKNKFFRNRKQTSKLLSLTNLLPLHTKKSPRKPPNNHLAPKHSPERSRHKTHTHTKSTSISSILLAGGITQLVTKPDKPHASRTLENVNRAAARASLCNTCEWSARRSFQRRTKSAPSLQASGSARRKKDSARQSRSAACGYPRD